MLESSRVTFFECPFCLPPPTARGDPEPRRSGRTVGAYDCWRPHWERRKSVRLSSDPRSLAPLDRHRWPRLGVLLRGRRREPDRGQELVDEGPLPPRAARPSL